MESFASDSFLILALLLASMREDIPSEIVDFDVYMIC